MNSDTTLGSGWRLARLYQRMLAWAVSALFVVLVLYVAQLCQNVEIQRQDETIIREDLTGIKVSVDEDFNFKARHLLDCTDEIWMRDGQALQAEVCDFGGTQLGSVEGLSDLPDPKTAKQNLGLGTMAEWRDNFYVRSEIPTIPSSLPNASTSTVGTGCAEICSAGSYVDLPVVDADGSYSNYALTWIGPTTTQASSVPPAGKYAPIIIHAKPW